MSKTLRATRIMALAVLTSSISAFGSEGKPGIWPCSPPPIDVSRWQRVDLGAFSCRLPPDYKEVKVRGFDSRVGRFENPNASGVLSYDYGRFSDPLTRAEWRAACVETIACIPARLAVGVGAPQSDGTVVVGAAWRNIEPGKHLTICGEARDRAHLEELLAVMHTFRFGPDSILGNPLVNWHRSEFAPDIRQRVHLDATQVPPFPHEDQTLKEPSRWPRKAVFNGKRCSLRIEVRSNDVGWFVKSLEEVPPGSRLILYYRAGADDWKSRYGPTYCWRADGALMERYWKAGNGRRYETWAYTYYPSGELFSFRHRSDGYELRSNARSAFEWFEEVYARGGTLIGAGFGSGGAGAKDSFVGYWMGEQVDYRQFTELETQAQRRAMR